MELLKFFADRIASLDTDKMFVTQDENVLSNVNTDTSLLSHCNHEEADTRMFIHIKHATSNGFREVILGI